MTRDLDRAIERREYIQQQVNRLKARELDLKIAELELSLANDEVMCLANTGSYGPHNYSYQTANKLEALKEKRRQLLK